MGCLAQASYLVADQSSGEAAVIDPQRDVAQYVEDARALGCRIAHVFLTHFHADFVAGHLELRNAENATIHLSAGAGAEFDFEPMGDGAVVHLGAIRLEVLQTPGHSPESMSILVHDPEFSHDAPYAVLTGDTLFIGDVGRPDLRAAQGWTAEGLGSMLYDSLQKFASLPDDTLVYPGHGAGSLCGKDLSTDTVSTMGVQRRCNYALQPMNRQQFIEIVTADQPDTPAYFTHAALLNTRERQTLDEALERELRPLSLDEALELLDDGAQLLDARDPVDFAGAHMRGSINVGLGGSFATWCGTVLDIERPIVLVAASNREFEAATRLGRIGCDTVAGYLAGGMRTLDDAPHLVDRVERITAGALAERLASTQPPLLIDVRSEREWHERRIEQAVHIPLSRLAERIGTLPAGRALVVHCTSDYRATIAASLMRRAGLRDVATLVGGVAAWESISAAPL
ncbi:MAG TPA: MBL fold metallo-hydrolase [Solirubrobacteraceae bacterium]|nr:MBL fold metallo-hydrolase [Solirubrobacteraceae bacterium]